MKLLRSSYQICQNFNTTNFNGKLNCYIFASNNPAYAFLLFTYLCILNFLKWHFSRIYVIEIRKTLCLCFHFFISHKENPILDVPGKWKRHWKRRFVLWKRRFEPNDVSFCNFWKIYFYFHFRYLVFVLKFGIIPRLIHWKLSGMLERLGNLV